MKTILKKRILAFIIDFLIVTAFIWILSIILYPVLLMTGFFAIFNFWLLLLAILILGYFTYLESSYGRTVGKSIMGIEVKANEGDLTYQKAIIRNLSKILWFPIIIDFLASFLTKDDCLRLLDKYAGTKVVLIEDTKENKD
ncbi:RDD family protein [Methanobacterium alcaliphilum]|uniref:RDD family protein n=1 Tax=Methanobacterium alcaliphilum TaxID=392018 RepID=UPI00200B16F4|nr:RDD family protein [Methanobacterium alcaliphilum]MCK9151600.1 RDD family protein [Methanobacterium alcaliphilum]